MVADHDITTVAVHFRSTSRRIRLAPWLISRSYINVLYYRLAVVVFIRSVGDIGMPEAYGGAPTGRGGAEEKWLSVTTIMTYNHSACFAIFGSMSAPFNTKFTRFRGELARISGRNAALSWSLVRGSERVVYVEIDRGLVKKSIRGHVEKAKSDDTMDIQFAFDTA